VTITLRRGGRDLAAELVGPLDAWTAEAPLSAHLHSGDVGWHLRLADAGLREAFVLWERDGEPVAAGLAEDVVLRTAVAPGHDRSAELAEAMAAVMPEFGYVDALGGTAVRRLLLERGWSVDPDPWVLLYRELGPDDAALADPATRPVGGEADVVARTAVQRSAFAPGSTFQPELWHRMAAGPTYDRRFDQVTWTPEGEAAAAATGWFAGAGRCAILEPVGTHADHRRAGYGRRVSLAVMAALARAGASGVRVHTPAANTAAVKAYESCGLRQVDWTTALVRPGAPAG
jgi:GNAT superfamily N-acetyltransferase